MKNKNQVCHDCQIKMETDNETIENGVLLKYKNQEEEVMVFKCNDCYSKNPSLNNYQGCEVYSRIVGYLRPVGQWNEGKKEEFKDRENYNIGCGCQCRGNC